MNRLFAAGALVTVLGLWGYAAGIVDACPGRAFSVTAVMVGITLLGVGRADPAEEGE
jgi:hypothetical protein